MDSNAVFDGFEIGIPVQALPDKCSQTVELNKVHQVLRARACTTFTIRDKRNGLNVFLVPERRKLGTRQ
jgi:hypothetical protein